MPLGPPGSTLLTTAFLFEHDFSRAKNKPRPAWALQAAEKLIRAAIFKGFVTGHDFSRADKANQINRGL